MRDDNKKRDLSTIQDFQTAKKVTTYSVMTTKRVTTKNVMDCMTSQSQAIRSNSQKIVKFMKFRPLIFLDCELRVI